MKGSSPEALLAASAKQGQSWAWPRPMSLGTVPAPPLRLEDGGRRFDGVGIRQPRNGEAIFVSFTLQLSRNGDTVAFDCGLQVPLSDPGAELAAEY